MQLDQSYLGRVLRAFLITASLCSTLGAQDQADDTGTLNTAAIIGNSVILTSDSALTRAGRSSPDAQWKIVKVGPQAACTIEGHNNDVSPTGDRIRIVGEEISTFARHERLGNLESSFPRLMAEAKRVLEASNLERERTGTPLLRYDREPTHKLGNGRFWVTGVICAGISHNRAMLRAAYLDTNPAKGDIQIQKESVTDHVAQGDPFEYYLLLQHGKWHFFNEGDLLEPTWPAFAQALQALRHSLNEHHSLLGLSSQTYEELLRGLYWSEINGTAGAILPPIRIWVMSSGSSQITQRVLDLP